MPAWRARRCTEDRLIYAGERSRFRLRVVVIIAFVSGVLEGFVGGEDGIVAALGINDAQSRNEDESQRLGSLWQQARGSQVF